jgi:hypothetical protein
LFAIFDIDVDGRTYLDVDFAFDCFAVGPLEHISHIANKQTGIVPVTLFDQLVFVLVEHGPDSLGDLVRCDVDIHATVGLEFVIV